MSDTTRFFPAERQQDLEINQKHRTAESTYFRYKKQMSKEVLVQILPMLIHSLSSDSATHSYAKIRSFSFFLRLCDQYKELLTDDYQLFGASEHIYAGCLAIKNSPLFDRLKSEHSQVASLLEKNRSSAKEEENSPI